MQKPNATVMTALSNFAPHAHWFLRLALFGPFIFHGAGKFFNAAGFSEMMQMPIALVILLGVVEVGGALVLIAGRFAPDWLVRLSGLGLAGVMLGAIVLVHAAHGWNSIGELGMEFQVTLLLVSLYFVVVGNQAAAQEA